MPKQWKQTSAGAEVKWVTGLNCLTVPCEPGTARLMPIYFAYGEPARGGYICPFCGGFYFRYKPCTHHMGQVMHIPCACLRVDYFHQYVAMNRKLPCAFCPREFHDFGPLAEHVRTDHAEVAMMLHQLAENVTIPKEGNDDMLPQVGGGRSNDRQGQQGGGRRQPPAVPFLKVEDLQTGNKLTARILGLETKSTGFNDVIVKIALEGKSFFLGLKAANPAYETLTNGLGFDENKWVGREFVIGLEWNEFYEKNFVAVFGVVPAAATEEANVGKKGRK